jgi:outer membrane protein OmpA-like peptidoglycan-associated protein
MAASLLGTIEEYLSSDVIQRVAASLGESPSNTEKAIQNAVPAILGGMIQRASTSDDAEAIARAVQSAPGPGPSLTEFLSTPASMQHAARTGQSLLATLFGSKLSSLIDLIAASSGITTSSASTLLSMLAPLVFSLVGREAAARGGGVSGLMSLLNSQKAEIMSFLPSELSAVVTELSPLDSFAPPIAPPTPTPTIVPAVVAREADGVISRAEVAHEAPIDVPVAIRERKSGWIVPPLILLALLGLGAWYFLGGQRSTAVPNQTAAPTAPTTPTTPTMPAPPEEASPAPSEPKASGSPEGVTRGHKGRMTTVALPDGKSVNVREDSAIYALAKYLESGEAAPKTFVFDRVQFESGSARLMRDSRGTVNRLAAILKAYPSTEIRLDGHTDNSGDTSKNAALSQARADEVKRMLARKGVAATRIATSGHGHDKPIASNDTPEGREQNRRIEVAVTKR